jgi:hypothetical protein
MGGNIVEAQFLLVLLPNVVVPDVVTILITIGVVLGLPATVTFSKIRPAWAAFPLDFRLGSQEFE